MPYRFTDTEKWKDEWFIELEPLPKLMFMYLADNCDIAGFFEFSMRRMRSDLHFTDEQIIESLKCIERAYVLSRDKKVLFLKNFCKHQKNTPLNHKNKAHIGIFYRVDNYKQRFGHDLIKIINKGVKPTQDKAKLEGLQTGLSISIGNIEFINFWNLYDNKVGNKKEVEKKWNLLKPKIQKQIIEILPQWKSKFDNCICYPETFINQERWNDDLSIKPKSDLKLLPGAFPDYYSKKFEASLQQQDMPAYWKHLRTLGYTPKKDSQQNIIDWVKAS